MSARTKILAELRLNGYSETAARNLLERADKERQDYQPAPVDRIERYINALRSADVYALVERRDDLVRFAKAVIAVANEETDPVYRSGYGTGRQHSGAEGWALDGFEAVVFTTYDGPEKYATADEYRCRQCGAIGGQGTVPKSLLDLMAMASRHECLPRVTDTAQGDSE